MENRQYTIEELLDAIATKKGNQVKKRLLFDQGKVGGLPLKWIILFFLALPLALYGGIFNPAVFETLGIAQAIIFFVVFLSMLMIMIFALSFINNNAALRKISPIWESYFPGIDIREIVSGRNSPYRDFFSYYAEALEQGMSGETLHRYLQGAFETMREENRELITAMERAK
jgi:hypothetical protein